MNSLITLLLLFPFLAFSQENNVPIDCNYKIEKINDSVSKVQVINYDSLILGETCYINWINSGADKPDGTLYIYDENGKKRRKATYYKGEKVGKHIIWYPTGEIEITITWITDDTYNWEEYYVSGKIKEIILNGNLDNEVSKKYYENGQLESIADWSNDGLKTWYKNGKPNYERNTKLNYFKSWFENGQLNVYGKLKNGRQRIGKWSYYDESGKLVRELFYDDSINNTSWYGNEVGYVKEIKY